MALMALEEMRLNLINELSRLFDKGHGLSSPVVIEVSEILDEVVRHMMALRMLRA